MKNRILLSALLLSACAVESQVRPLDNGEFRVTEHRAPLFSGIENSEDDAQKTAAQYCKNLGKKLGDLHADSNLNTVEGPMIYTAVFSCVKIKH